MQKPNVQERNTPSEGTIRADDAERRIARAMRIGVGNELRKIYGHDVLRRLDR
jgi:hypothetical protein